MRRGARKAMLALGAVLLGMATPAAPSEPKGSDGPVRLTIEVDWTLPALPTLPTGPAPTGVALELTEGRAIEVVAPPGAAGGEPLVARGEGAWDLGAAPSGRVRARIEAPLGASLRIVAGGQAFLFPIASILEGPQRTAPPALADIGVERLPWDALEVHLDGDGTAPPGGSWPLTVGLNVLSPELSEVALRFTAELRPARGGPAIWQVERTQVVPTDTPRPPALSLGVPAPPAEGTYLLELRATWEPAASRETSRLGRRLGKWRRNPPPMSAVRRVTLATVGPEHTATPPPVASDATVDAIDPARGRLHRVMAAGRAPAAEGGGWPVPESVLAGLRRGDRLRGLFPWGGTESATLPPADAEGRAWTAFGLRVPRPGRPHRLSLTVAGPPPAALGVALLALGKSPGRTRVLLDACASGPPAAEGGAATYSWPVWPDAAEPVLILVNRDPAAPVQLRAVELVELAADPPPAPLPETHPAAPRTLAVHLAGPHPLDRFGGDGDALAQARNLAAYLAYCGAGAVVLPDGLADRARRQALEGQAEEDATGPDRLDLALRVLGRRGLSALVEARLDGPLPGLPAPGSAEALAGGLVRVDRRGAADGPAYQPLHPAVRAAMRRQVVAALAPRRAHPNLVGVLVRLGPGCTLPGAPDTGLDDRTYGQFLRAMFRPEDAGALPGPEAGDPDRFAARQRFLAGAGAAPWLSWRAREVAALYAELARAARREAGGAILAVATPGLDDGPAGAEARRHDRAGLSPDRAWLAVGLDLRQWPAGDDAPLVLRGVDPAGDDLAHDLGVDPDLDAPVLARPGRGLMLLPGGEPIRAAGPEVPDSKSQSQISDFKFEILNLKSDIVRAKPTAEAVRLAAATATDDEPLGHAVAVLDARWVVLAASAVAGREERLRRFARVLRGLPAPAEAGAPSPRLNAGVAVRSWTAGGRTYLGLANDTPYTLLVDTVLPPPAEAAVFDLGRGLNLEPAAAPAGGRRLVVKLDPFGVAAVRVGHGEARPGPVAVHFLDAPEPQAVALKERLGRLGPSGAAGPPNPGFEPVPAGEGEVYPVRNAPAAAGWSAWGDPANAVELDTDRPHSGQASLRLDANALPAAAVGDWFAPPGGSALTLRAWVRCDRPNARVRVWIDGVASGQPLPPRRAELPGRLEWTPVTIPLADLPADGLDRARLRFELLAAGRLWVDDLSLTGQGPSEPERRARRVLVAAIAAYNDGRFADFARLANSRLARRGAPPAAAIRTGSASDLPPGRRLR
jgi:hypothetical protein